MTTCGLTTVLVFPRKMSSAQGWSWGCPQLPWQGGMSPVCKALPCHSQGPTQLTAPWRGSYCAVTKSSSSDHRITEWLKLAATSGNHLVQFPMLKQGHAHQVAQGHILWCFQYLQRWRLHSLSEQPV